MAFSEDKNELTIIKILFPKIVEAELYCYEEEVLEDKVVLSTVVTSQL